MLQLFFRTFFSSTHLARYATDAAAFLQNICSSTHLARYATEVKMNLFRYSCEGPLVVFPFESKSENVKVLWELSDIKINGNSFSDSRVVTCVRTVTQI
jgi:hypothetical protein